MSYYIFFTGLPKNYPTQSIRDLFSRCGNVVSMKLSTRTSTNNAGGGRTITDAITQSGLIEYPDEASQQAAIASFNGCSIDTPRGAVRIRVGASSGMTGGERRGRGGPTIGAGGGMMTNPSNDASAGGAARYVESDLAYSEAEIIAQQQQQNYRSVNNNNNNHMMMNAGAKRDPLQMSLRAAPPQELSEAVEQLRVMCLEQPDRARILLDTFPQLRRAVCMILQREDKLPIPLPPEAFVERKVLLQQQQQQQKLEQDAAQGKNRNGNDDDNNTSGMIDEDEQQKIADIINELSADALQELLVADFDSQEGEMDETTRQHFMKIQRQLRAMAEE